jgi:benzoyl-CoA 2,3-dioxygenase component B
MLKEEAHHMFVGATGLGRVARRTVDLMKEHDTDDVSPYGGINIDVLQRYLNFHYSVSIDLFGSETSTNAANYFAAGLKGRFQEARRDDDHQLRHTMRTIPAPAPAGDADGGRRIVEREVGELQAINATLRDDYTDDCRKGVDRWNRVLAEVGAELVLPHVGFHRAVGEFAGVLVSPGGKVVDQATWDANIERWLPTEADSAYIASLMSAVTEPGKMAGWIAPPAQGIGGRPLDMEYVRL